MSAPPGSKGEPVENYSQLVEYLEKGCKSKEDFRIGTEHEKFCFDLNDLSPLPYEGERGIQKILEGMRDEFGWEALYEGDNVIALTLDGANITLEPGGQFELSGAPLKTIHQTCTEIHTHLAQVRQIADPLGVAMLGMGFQPKWARGDIPWMPKGRYRIMGNYMPKRGSLGLDMMLRTCTVQVNLDFENEQDMVKKMRVSLALQPVATAFFANSPFKEGKPSGFKSYRSHIWTDTDPDRCGVLPFVFEDGMGFERYVEHVLDVPMYFIHRDGQYIDCSGLSFRDFLDGNLSALPGEKPTINDWADHLTTLFPEVRLKRYIEMRGADGGPWKSLCALPAFWSGLLYHQPSLDAAWDLVKDWSIEDHEELRASTPREGLQTMFKGRKLQSIALETLSLARQGLEARKKIDWDGQDESKYLSSLQITAETGMTQADKVLQKYLEEWDQSIDPIFKYLAY